MLPEATNERLTRVGPGTPMGNLMRHYWMPIAAVEELLQKPVKKVRLLGEDLALFRDRAGTLGLVAERCPHRGASLAYGFTEREGLRCPYHGWLFSPKGECLEMPNQFEDNPALRQQCAVASYPVREHGGLVFAYLGTKAAPLLPKYDLFMAPTDGAAFTDIGFAVIPCNWLQIQENTLDPTHVEWLHGQLFNRILEERGEPSTEFAKPHVKIAFDPFEFGIIKRRLKQGQSEDDQGWTIGHPAIFPNLLRVGGGGLSQFQIRVPMDDVNTLHFWYTYYELPLELEPLIDQIRVLSGYYTVQVQNPDGSWVVDHIDGQDAMVWSTQGTISDRRTEHLCQGDVGVVMFRKQLLEQLDIVEGGGDPMGVRRDPVDDEVIEFPQETKPAGFGVEDNPFRGFARTQAKFSPRVQRLVQLIDERLTYDRKQPVQAS
jgi:5,5'-dehydrodivanillate O-demethylase